MTNAAEVCQAYGAYKAAGGAFSPAQFLEGTEYRLVGTKAIFGDGSAAELGLDSITPVDGGLS